MLCSHIIVVTSVHAYCLYNKTWDICVEACYISLYILLADMGSSLLLKELYFYANCTWLEFSHILLVVKYIFISTLKEL